MKPSALTAAEKLWADYKAKLDSSDKIFGHTLLAHDNNSGPEFAR